MHPNTITDWPRFLTIALLVLIRLSGLMLLAPLFSSAGIPPRAKAAFVIAVTVLVAPVAATITANATHLAIELNAASILGELGVGLVFGLSLSLLNEAIMFAATMLGIEFSFSLVNLLDPNTKVETQVLGQLLNWLGLLVLIGAGLDRTLLAAVLRSFATAPVGHVVMHANTGAAVAAMASGIFFAGLQLAAPVVAAAVAVEIMIALVSRLSPHLPVMMVSVPAKTMVSYIVLIGSLALWPVWIERHFTSLLDAAQKLVA